MVKKRKLEQRFSEYYAGLATAEKIAYLEAMLQALRQLPSTLPPPTGPASPGDLSPTTIDPPQPGLSQNVQQRQEAQPESASRPTRAAPKATPKSTKRSRRP